MGLEPGSSSGQWRTSGSGLSADAPIGPELSPGSRREPEVFARGWRKECGTCRLPSAIVRPFTPLRWLTVTLWGLGAKTNGPAPRGEPHLNQHGRVARNCSGGDGEGRCQPPLALWDPLRGSSSKLSGKWGAPRGSTPAAVLIQGCSLPWGGPGPGPALSFSPAPHGVRPLLRLFIVGGYTGRRSQTASRHTPPPPPPSTGQKGGPQTSHAGARVDGGAAVRLPSLQPGLRVVQQGPLSAPESGLGRGPRGR